MQSTEDIAVPDELADALGRAASSVPGGPPELTDIRRRHRHGQLRRSAAILTGVVALVAASIVTPRLLTGPATPVESVGPAATTSPPPTPTPQPAQRLLVVGAGSVIAMIQRDGEPAPDLPERPDPSLPNLGYPPDAVGVVGRLLEVTDSGEFLPVDIPAIEPGGVVTSFLFLTDGRLATLELVSKSDVVRRDGPCITDAAIYLHVIEADGSASTSRDVRTPCESVRLVGSSAEEVFLVRTPHEPQNQAPIPGRRLVAHRLSDGTERTVANLDGVGEAIVEVSIGSGSFIVSDRWTVGCRLQVVDLATGAVRDIDLATVISGCDAVDAARLSPDGTRLAVGFDTGAGTPPYEVGFAVVDLAGPSLRLRELVDAVGANEALGRFPAVTPVGMAWTDDTTVQVAWAHYPQDPDRVIMIDEILDVQTYAVP